MIPAVPYGVLVHTDGTSGTPGAAMTIDGNALPTDVISSQLDNIAWIPICVPDEWSAWTTATITSATGRPAEVTNPYQAARARIVSQSMRIIYTANMWTATGFTVTQHDDAALLPSTINSAALTYYNATTSANYATDTVRAAPYDFQLRRNLKPGTSTRKAFETTQVNQQFTGEGHTFHNVSSQPIVLYDSATGFTLLTTSPIANPGIAFYDHNFSCATIRLTGMPAGATVRVEYALCVEYEPMSTSAFFTLTAPSPMAQPEAIKLVDKAIDSTETKSPAAAESKASSLLGAATSTANTVLGAILSSNKPAVGLPQRTPRPQPTVPPSGKITFPAGYAVKQQGKKPPKGRPKSTYEHYQRSRKGTRTRVA